ncbi:MAG TPA: endopeptidase La [Kofleriaceae bacterium]|nr:endopeptidase La [Kofleriaceae bacterium]
MGLAPVPIMALDLLPMMELPILPLRTMVLFPHAALPMTLNRTTASLAVSAAGEEGLIAVVTQAHPEAEEPIGSDLFAIGTGAVVRQLTQPGADSAMVIVEGLERVAIVDIVQTHPYLRARVRRLASERPMTDSVYIAARSNLLDSFAEMVHLSSVLPDELGIVARSIADDSALTDMIGSALVETAPAIRQDILATLNVRRRMDKLIEVIEREVQALKIREKLRVEVQSKIADSQKEIVLREQLKAIRRELGEERGEENQLAELRAKIDKGGLPEEARKEATRELDRLQEMPAGSPEYSMVRNYCEWMAELPWSVTTATPIDITRAKQILDEDHFDLDKVKERILEFLAVQRLKRTQRGPLICLVGPPGVGKTSIGRSIARATNRKFVRISLGGTNDEAEIRGHRRTYIGSLPGQIIRGLRRAGSCDPVFMLDEIDKLGRDYRGDPASALLEVLDPEQNSAFRDHYLDVPFDLSRVMFVATANVLDTIPEPLRDRMELIDLPGYIDEDKLEIAKRYLVPKQVEDNGLLLGDELAFTDEALLDLIRGYTHEAGVRKLEQLIASVARKRARQLAEGATGTLVVSRAVVAGLLGPAKFRVESQVHERTKRPGVAVALAWTASGGELLYVESTKLGRGRGNVTLTGQMGDVMQESARTAVSWVRAHADRYGIAEDVFEKHDIHIHVPAGAVPKDGPSAGVVMVLSLVSLLTNRPVAPLTALTGEITLSGVLLPIGGIKEKVLAARRSGLSTIIVPMENEPNVRDEVPHHLRGDVDIKLASSIEEAIDLALTKGDTLMASQKIQDVMTKQVHCVGEDSSLREVARLMRDQNIGDVLVTDAQNKLRGIITDRDIVVRAVADEGNDLDQLRAKDICTADHMVTLQPQSGVEEAVELMRDKAVRRIPVVENEQPIGIVSIGDLAAQRDPQSALGQISRAAPNN